MSDNGSDNNRTRPPVGVDATRASSTMGRNTLWNLLGNGLPLLLALVSVPAIIHGAGAGRFGLITLAWAILGYFSLFDLGLGRATIKFLAEAFEHDRASESREVFWTSLLMNALFGVIGASLLAALSPLLVESVLNVPAGLQDEALGAFYLLALGVPVTTVSAALRGTLEARHRFGLVNTIQAPNSILTQAAPLIVLPFSQDLRWLVGVMVLSRVWGAGVFLVAALRNLEQPMRGPFFSSTRLRALLSYGSWQAVTNGISPIMENADRFVIGSIASMTSVAFYVTPAEITKRLLIIPLSMGRTAFPIFSSGTSVEQRSDVYARAMKQTTLVMAVISVTLIVFAHDLLLFWVGPTFAQESASVLRILAVGLLLNSLAVLPFGLIQGTGRPDITAKFHLLELPMYLLLLWYGLHQWGVVGAALAWSFRVGVDFILLTCYAQLSDRLDMRAVTKNRLNQTLAFSLSIVIAGWLLQTAVVGTLSKLCLLVSMLAIGTYISLRWLLTVDEKSNVINRIVRVGAPQSMWSSAGRKRSRR